METTLILMVKAGLFLFTIGLLIGAFLSKLRNPRMGLSAHLTAVQTGPALIALAWAWPFFNVPHGWTAFLAFGLVISSYVLTLGIFLAAFFGASKALPIAGAGFAASVKQEQFVTILVRGSSILMAVCCIILCAFAVSA